MEVCFPWTGKHQKYQLNWNCSLIGSWKGGVVGNCRFLLKKKKSSRNIWLLQLCPNKTLILKIDIFLRGSLENHAVWHGPSLTVQWGWWEEVVWRQHTDGQVADGKQGGQIPRHQAGSSRARRPINELHFQGDLSESLFPSGSGAVWKATSSSWGPEPPPWPVSEPPRSLFPSPSRCLRPLRYPGISS